MPITLIIILLLAACRKAEPSTRESEIQGDGTMLYVRVTGDTHKNRVLIGVHGGPGYSSDYMTSLERLASDGITVVLYDQRGAGRSSEPTNGYGLSQYVEDLEAVRESVGAEKVDIFGHSWGGIVALRYATVYPDRVRSLILMGSAPPRYVDLSAGFVHLDQRILELQHEGIIPKELPSTSKEYLRTILPAYFSDPRFEIPEEMKSMSFTQAASDRTFAELGEWDFASEVSQLNLSVLMMWGEADPFGMGMADATKTALSGSNVKFVLLKGCGHYWHECPLDFFMNIREFLGLSSRP
jgi:proline iminopeptidase